MRKRSIDKGKPVARRGRKTTGLTELAGLPKVTDEAVLGTCRRLPERARTPMTPVEREEEQVLFRLSRG
jgi:hypothetical protein